MPRPQSILYLLAIAALGFVAILMFVKQNVDPQLTRIIQDNIDQQLYGTDYFATLRGARFIEGVGFEIQDLKIQHHARPQSPVFHTEALMVNSPTTLGELLSKKIQPTAIELKHAKLAVERDASGAINLSEVVKSLFKFDSKKPFVPVSLKNCSVSVSDNFQSPGVNSKFPRNVQVSLHDINLDITEIQHQQRQLLKLVGTAKGDEIPELKLNGFIDLDRKKWMAKIGQAKVRLTDQWLMYVPEKYRQAKEFTRGIKADIEFRAQVEGNLPSSSNSQPNAQPNQPNLLQTLDLDYQVSARITDLSVRNQRLPLPVYNVRAMVNIDKNGIEIANAIGKMGESSFNFNANKSGAINSSGKAWKVSGWVKDLDFKHDLLAPFPGVCTRFCRDFSPEGTSDIQFAFAANNHGVIQRDVRVQLTDMSFEFIKFPFRINNCVGTVHYNNDRINYQVQGSENGQVVEFKGHVNNPGPNSTYVFDIDTKGTFPIDNKLMKSLDAIPKLAKYFGQFRPQGNVSLAGRVEKNDARSEVRQSLFDIRLHDCDCRHEKFDYPIHNINGLIKIRNDKFFFEEVSGFNTSSQIVCNGVLNNVDGLRLNFLAGAVALDDRLRNALIPNLQDVWDSFRPSGTVNLGRIDLAFPVGAKEVDIRIQADLAEENDSHHSSVSVFPVWFPYRLNQLTGTINIGGGTIQLNKIKAKHERTWMTFGGVGSYSANSWAVQLQRMLVGSLQVDEDLLRALPISLQSSVRALKFAGHLNLNGEIMLAGHTTDQIVSSGTTLPGDSLVQQVAHENSHTTTMGWDLRLDMEQAKMLIGLPLENIFGSIKLVGRHDGKNGQCRGEIDAESLTYNDIQVTNLKGPIWIDDLQSRAGRFANNDQQPATPLLGQTMAGQIEIDGWVSHEGEQPFFVQTAVNDVKLSEVAADIAPQFRDIAGSGYGVIRVGGNATQAHSIRGDGNVQLRNAEIYQLPVMLAMLKVLNVKEATRTAFDSGNIDFTVAGEQFDLKRIELIGDAISLIGQGTLNIKRQIDLNFYTVMGRNRLNIPILSELYRAGSQRILWINVDGTLDNPQTNGEVLPGLNERLKRLFQPVNQSGNTPQPFNFQSEPRR